MNCPEWEERLADGDPEAAAHLQQCPYCAAFADGLARDARLLHTLPQETLEVDYAAIRTAARRGALQRTRRRKVLTVLAIAAAAAILIAVKLPTDRQPPATVTKISAPLPALNAVRKTPAKPSTIARVQARRRRPRINLDRKFADFLRTQYELKRPAHSQATEITTGNPNVTILILKESKGEANE